MRGLRPDEFIVIVAALAVVMGFAVWRLALWIRKAPLRSDPWDEHTDELVRAEDAVPVCHRCLTPAPPGQWSCERCGTAVGPYNNWMPYLYLFSEGEVLRSGVTDHVRPDALTVAGFVLLPLGLLSLSPFFLLFAAWYWFRVFKNLSGRSAQDETQAA